MNSRNKNLKIYLINSPAFTERWATCYPPLGILYIAANLEKYGYNVEVIDMQADEKLTFDDIKNILCKEKPDIVGLSVYTPWRFDSFKLIKMAKETGAKTIIGGPHVTAMPELILRNYPYVDIAVRGEGEETVLEIVQNENLENIQGIVYRKKGDIISNKPRPFIDNLDSLPFPARHLVPMDKYFQRLNKYEYSLHPPGTTMMVARGCINACTFCESPFIWGKRIRFRTPQSVCDEIEQLKNEFGIQDLFFFDDTFNFSPDWIKRFHDELKKRNLNISYRCLARVMITKETLRLMKDSGCYHISFGVESASDKVLKAVKKHITKEQIIKAINWAHELGIFVKVFIMVGLPEETREDVKETEQLITTLPINEIAMGYTSLLPGTELFMQSKIGNDIWFNQEIDFQNPGGISNTPPHQGLLPYEEFINLKNEMRTKFLLVNLNRNLRMVRKLMHSKSEALKYIFRLAAYLESQVGSIFRLPWQALLILPILKTYLLLKKVFK